MQIDRTLVTPPASYLVDTETAKYHLRVTYSDDDAVIDTLVAAATEYVEHHTNRAYVDRTYRIDMSGFCSSVFLWPAPLSSVSSVQYYDDDDAQQTVSSGEYRISQTTAMLHFDSGYSYPSVYDRHDAVSITYIAGSATIPDAAKQACLLAVGDMYENREAQSIGAALISNPTIVRLFASLRVPLQ